MYNPIKSSKTTLKANLLLRTNCLLGEGAIWNQEDQRLYWVDIELKQLHCFDPIGLKHDSTSFQKKITTVVPTVKGELLIGMEDGIYEYKKTIEELTLISSNPENNTSGNRFNDGKCDPFGRFWIGTMGSNESAALYRLDADYQLHTVLTGITNSNGILWSPDNLTMYYIDTPTYEVTAFDFDNNTGQISNPRAVINIPASMGYPDGATIDSEGMIWIAMWGGYCVSRWNPKTGKLLSTIEIPSKNVTSCAFGGANLDTLYITSARGSISEDDLIQYPDSGGLFTARPRATGIKANLFKGLS